jgi:hypothetical protein
MRDRNHAFTFRPGAIGRNLIVLMAMKLVVLTLLYWLFFSPSHRPEIDVARHIAGTTLGQ